MILCKYHKFMLTYNIEIITGILWSHLRTKHVYHSERKTDQHPSIPAQDRAAPTHARDMQPLAEVLSPRAALTLGAKKKLLSERLQQAAIYRFPFARSSHHYLHISALHFCT